MQNKHMLTATIEYAHYVEIGQVAVIEIVWKDGFRDRFKASDSERYYTEYRGFLSDSEHEQILKLIEQAQETTKLSEEGKMRVAKLRALGIKSFEHNGGEYILHNNKEILLKQCNVIDGEFEILEGASGFIGSPFCKCRSIKVINKNKWRHINKLFYACRNLREVDISEMDTSECINMAGLFSQSALGKINIEGIDTHKVVSMKNMFAGDGVLSEIKGLDSLDTSNVKRMDSMFRGCRNLKEIQLSHFDFSSLYVCDYMLNSCKSIKELDLTHFHPIKPLIKKAAFGMLGNNNELVVYASLNTDKEVIDQVKMYALRLVIK